MTSDERKIPKSDEWKGARQREGRELHQSPVEGITGKT